MQSGCSTGQGERKSNQMLFDQAHILTDIKESVSQQLQIIRDQYGIEVVLATVEETSEQETIKELAVRLFDSWDIGREYGGRGLLLLISEKDKAVRLEVGSSLEGIYTDLFTSYVENKQLKSYYLSGQLSSGIIALIEEIEARAQAFSADLATEEYIADLDMRFLSAGGGADVHLHNFKEKIIPESAMDFPPGTTPEEAWQTLLQSWREKNRNPDIGVYTPVTRLIYRAFTNQPDRRFVEDVRTWSNKPYEVIQKDGYAVIFFGNKKGWENAPFLFCRTDEGWQFDMVHQRKIVRMGRSPLWGIERGEHPYMELLSRCPYYMGQDIPLQGDDLYTVRNDAVTARQILVLENRLKAEGETFETLLQLGRLYTLTSMGQQRITFLNKAHSLKPDHPEVAKLLAIAHVDAYYQYESALSLMEQYVNMLPSDSFGHFFKGYLHLMLKEYSKAIGSLNKGLEISPNAIYGLCKLARAYHARNQRGDRQQAKDILQQLQNTAPKHIRTQWLAAYLAKSNT